MHGFAEKPASRTDNVIDLEKVRVTFGEGKNQVMFLGLWYHDKFVRTAQGWRMSERVEQKCFDYNVPGGVGTG